MIDVVSVRSSDGAPGSRLRRARGQAPRHPGPCSRISLRSMRATITCLALASPAAAADLLKIASPQRGSWEGAIPELGRQQGIFQKHGLDLDILYTAGAAETLQAVISGAVDIGLSAGVTGVMGAFSKNAPIRIIGASSTGSRELF